MKWVIIVIVLFIIYDVIPTYFYKLIYKLKRPKSGNNLYLTFDDGPSKYTNHILDLLKKYDIKCTFFVVGDFALKNKDLIERMYHEGHLIGIHSLKHKNAWFMGFFRTFKDFRDSTRVLKDLKFYRPPWGNINLFSLYFVSKYKLKLVFWNVMAEDWRANISENEIKTRIINRVRGGDIICLHDGRGKNNAPYRTLKALEKALPILLERGYNFRRLDSYDEK